MNHERPLDDATENEVDWSESQETADDVSDIEADGDGVDVSAQFQDEIAKLEQGVWHAPQGKGTKIIAVIILVAMGLSILSLIAMAVINLMND